MKSTGFQWTVIRRRVPSLTWTKLMPGSRVLFGGSCFGWVFCGTEIFVGGGCWWCLGGVAWSEVASASMLDGLCFCLLALDWSPVVVCR